MNFALLKYFIHYIFYSKTRQKLLLLSILGLGLSSFSLTVLQGVMGGLQHGLIKRSKDVKGVGHLQFNKGVSAQVIEQVQAKLNNQNIDFISELTSELLIKYQNRIYPVLLHGLNYNEKIPPFLSEADKSGIILASDLGFSLNAFLDEQMVVISPNASDFVLTELPRQSVISVSDFLTTNIPEVDSFEAWVRISFLQNLLKTRSIEKLRILNTSSFQKLKKMNLDEFKEEIIINSWEDSHKTLTWALALESRVMIFLFIGMCFLLGICIVSGNLIFFNKIKKDLASFWILGLSRLEMMRIINIFGQLISLFFSFIGVVLGLILLTLLSKSKIVLMPSFFVERSIPVNIQYNDLILAFLVPYLIAGLFTYLTFKIFKSENTSFLDHIQKA